jgi:hypothetical protein
MGYEFKVNKTIIIIILFLFLFGTVIQLSRSNFFIRLTTGNEQNNNSTIVSSALSAQEAKRFKQDKFLIVFDPKNEESLVLRNNLEKTFDYLKKDYEVVPVTEIPENLSGYQDVIIAFSNLDEVSNFAIFIDYADEGGKLFFAIRPELENTLYSIYRKMGIYELGSNFVNENRVILDSDLLLQGKGTKFEGEFLYNNSLPVHLSESCTVLAHASKENPLLWTVPYGKGDIMIFNGTMLGDKISRGMITGALSYLNDDFIYPIINSKVVYIDDFPAPFPEGYNKDIYKDYKRDTATFFRDIWWTDMERIAIKNDVKYTGVFIQTYNNRVKGSFEDKAGLEKLKIFGRDLIKSGGEIGIHGYNHQSLTKDQSAVKEYGYKAWPSEENMVASLTEAKEYFDEIFPNYTLRTYVPPSNVLSEEGKKAIKKAIPSVNILASLYEDDPIAPTYTQEFEIGNTFIEMPRFTSGYLYTNAMKWTSITNVTMYGAFSHFVHPDDLLDIERSGGKSWGKLEKEYDKLLEDIKVNYPWLESMTASESGGKYTEYNNAELFISQENNTIKVYINNFAGNLDFLLRSDKEIKHLENCEVERAGKDHYLVHAKAEKIEIQLGGRGKS